MITSKSPRRVLKLAYALGLEVLPKYFSPFSRHAFTKPQLFACLVLREHQKKSFRGIETLLADSPAWLAEIGLSKASDHTSSFPRLRRRPSLSKLRGTREPSEAANRLGSV